jgi:hypothetical protein
MAIVFPLWLEMAWDFRRAPVGVSTATVTRMAAGLGRHAILLLARDRVELLGTVGEPLVLDHFETFESTQDYPFGMATLVGSRPHRSTGRITDARRGCG